MSNTSSQSPVKVHKIALVNGANLNEQFVVIKPAEAEIREGDMILQRAHPAVLRKQFEFASKRRPRAIRKARKMGRAAVMLFAMREDGTHFPISIKQRQVEVKKYVDRTRSQLALRDVVPGVPIDEQKKGMSLYRTMRHLEGQGTQMVGA
jgi:hypothetical protein